MNNEHNNGQPGWNVSWEDERIPAEDSGEVLSLSYEERYGSSRAGKKKSTVAQEIFDWVEIVVFSLTFVLILFTYVGRLAVVQQNSMQKTLEPGDTLIISNLFYTPKTGDIVVFQLPYGENNLEEPLVKRIIATEGQTLYIDSANWNVYVYEDSTLTVEQVLSTVKPLGEEISGDIVREAYINYISTSSMGAGQITSPYTVGEGQVFVMGDNRSLSMDSRMFGAIEERFILGRAIIRVLPFEKFGAV